MTPDSTASLSLAIERFRKAPGKPKKLQFVNANWSVVMRADQPKFRLAVDAPARILVIDDDPIMREFAAVYLKTPGLDLALAAHGGEGLEQLAASRFDLVLSDLEMPVLDGFDFLRRVRADPVLRAMPVVLVTGRDDLESIDRAFALGATSFVTRPVNWRLLSYHLRFVLRAQRTRAF